MKCVLVTGATGFLGGHVVQSLRAKGVDVIAMGRNGQKCAALRKQGFRVICHDLTRPVALSETIDAIVHCAALSQASGPRAAFEMANVDGTRNIVEFAQRCGVKRFVHISSPTIYFKMSDAVGVREDMVLPKPINHYGATKVKAEKIVLGARDIGPIILRPRGIYGPGDTTLLPSILQAAKRPLPVLRRGRGRIDLTFVEDVVSAIHRALDANDSAVGEAFNISGGEVLPIRDIVDQVCGAFGIRARWRALPMMPVLMFAGAIEVFTNAFPKCPPPSITRYSVGLFAYEQSLDISKVRKVLGWSPKVNFSQGLQRTVAGIK